MRLTLLAALIYLLLLSPYAVVVTSESMEPTLKVGDLVILSHREPHVGDVIVYKHGDILIIHRLVQIQDGKYITKGDNYQTNPTPDPWDVYPEDTVGVAVLRIPYVGYIVMALKDHPILFILLLLLIALYDRYVPEIKRDRRKTYITLLIIILLVFLRVHPRTPERAYLVDWNFYQTYNSFYVEVIFYSSGDHAVYIQIIMADGNYTFIRTPVKPGTSGVRSIGLFVNSYPLEVKVWKTRSRSGERSTKAER